jgi:hypothetical protein
MTLELQLQAHLIDTITAASVRVSCATERAKSQHRRVEWREIGMATAKGKIEYRGTPACREACLHVGCGSTGRGSARAGLNVMRAWMLAKSRAVRVGMRRAAMECPS